MNRLLFAGALAAAASVGLCMPLAAQQLFAPDGGTLPPPPGERAEAPDQAADHAPGEVLTRGPVHEAFAEPVPFNPRAGVIVPKQPPAAIEELPPEQKPEGDNVAWISGYWTWDDDRQDYVWVSGIYRVVPPNRQWVPGYWHRVATGHQWVPGFWNEAKADVEYYPAPPKSLEVGPSSEAPSVDHVWVPGYWTWRETRYAWRTGYWTPAHAGWMWVPSHYVWTPHGYVFVAGYWDVPFERRGLLFAPVYFDPLVVVRPRFCYRPSVVISVDVLSNHLFCHPAHHCYRFGDYYAASYVNVGIVPWFSFHVGHHGYCPIYAHSHWRHTHDHDPHWHVSLRMGYEHRRDHVDARPPRTFVAQQTVINNIQNTTIVNNNVVNNNVNVRQMTLARPLSQVAASRDNGLRLEQVDSQQQERLRNQARDVRRFREERGRLETSGGGADRGAGPRRLEMRSPVAGRSITSDAPRPGDNSAPDIGTRDNDRRRGGSRAADVPRSGGAANIGGGGARAADSGNGANAANSDNGPNPPGPNTPAGSAKTGPGRVGISAPGGSPGGAPSGNVGPVTGSRPDLAPALPRAKDARSTPSGGSVPSVGNPSNPTLPGGGVPFRNPATGGNSSGGSAPGGKSPSNNPPGGDNLPGRGRRPGNNAPSGNSLPATIPSSGAPPRGGNPFSRNVPSGNNAPGTTPGSGTPPGNGAAPRQKAPVAPRGPQTGPSDNGAPPGNPSAKVPSAAAPPSVRKEGGDGGRQRPAGGPQSRGPGNGGRRNR